MNRSRKGWHTTLRAWEIESHATLPAIEGSRPRSGRNFFRVFSSLFSFSSVAEGNRWWKSHEKTCLPPCKVCYWYSRNLNFLWDTISIYWYSKNFNFPIIFPAETLKNENKHEKKNRPIAPNCGYSSVTFNFPCPYRNYSRRHRRDRCRNNHCGW